MDDHTDTWESICKCGLRVRHYYTCPSCASLRARVEAAEAEVARLREAQLWIEKEGITLDDMKMLEESEKRLREAVDEMEQAYPPDIFTEPTPDDFKYLSLGTRGISERLHGSWARHLIGVIRRRAGG